jgi:hypothetical protein
MGLASARRLLHPEDRFDHAPFLRVMGGLADLVEAVQADDLIDWEPA